MRLCGFRVTHVFDIADTEGRPLPELDHRAQAEGETLLPRLESAAAAMGIAIEYREETGSPNGWSEGGKVVVNATLSTAAKCGTLAHELAHLCCAGSYVALAWRRWIFTGRNALCGQHNV
jgi:hypothetical protein